MTENTEEKENLSEYIVWFDFETTGFPDDSPLLEVACIVTDNELNEVGSYVSIITDVDVDALVNDDDCELELKPGQIRCWSKHFETGLIDEIKAAYDADELLPTLGEVTENIISLLNSLGITEDVPPRKKPPLAGSSVGFDRIRLKKFMSRVNELIHYRNINISSIRELQKRWRPDMPEFPRESAHRAEQDLRESIGFLRHFRSQGFIG